MNILCPRCKQQPRPTVRSMYCRPCERAYRAEHRPETCAKHKRYREKNKGGSRVNTQRVRRSPVGASIYSLRGYDKWVNKVRQTWKVDEKRISIIRQRGSTFKVESAVHGSAARVIGRIPARKDSSATGSS